jgi:hypothetical protein
MRRRDTAGDPDIAIGTVRNRALRDYVLIEQAADAARFLAECELEASRTRTSRIDAVAAWLARVLERVAKLLRARGTRPEAERQ